VDIEGAVFWNIEDRFRKYLAVGRNDKELIVLRFEFRGKIFIQLFRLKDLDSADLGPYFHGRGCELLSAPGGSVQNGNDKGGEESSLLELIKHAYREVGSAEENERGY